jgi:hypothetical protein
MKDCGDESPESGRDGVPGAYAFFARYVLMPWQSCLDVGGGMGVGLRILRSRSRFARAIDLDVRLESYGVKLGRIEDEADSSCDWVIAVDSIEHNEDDVKFLSHCWRVCREGVFVTTPNLAHHPDRKWPYHIREYTPEMLSKLFDQVAPDARRIHFGGDVYGGYISIKNLSPQWEHQGVLCYKHGGALTRSVLKCREVMMTVIRRNLSRG